MNPWCLTLHRRRSIPSPRTSKPGDHGGAEWQRGRGERASRNDVPTALTTCPSRILRGHWERRSHELTPSAPCPPGTRPPALFPPADHCCETPAFRTSIRPPGGLIGTRHRLMGGRMRHENGAQQRRYAQPPRLRSRVRLEPQGRVSLLLEVNQARKRAGNHADARQYVLFGPTVFFHRSGAELDADS